MNLLNNLKVIRFKENIIRVIPLFILLISFYFTGELFLEKEGLKLEYNEAMAKIGKKETATEIVIKEIDAIDTQDLEVLLYIAAKFKYSRVDVINNRATFEFNEDAFFEVRDFEKALDSNEYKYELQMAQGEGSWNGIKVEVSL